MTGPSPHDAKSDARSSLGQRSDDTLGRVAVYVAGGLVTGGVVLAATNVGPEQHTWWGRLLIGVPLTWLSFTGLVFLTFRALRTVVGALRWSVSQGAVRHAIARIVSFPRIGYPQDVPTSDTCPLLAVLAPVASDEHVVRIATETAQAA